MRVVEAERLKRGWTLEFVAKQLGVSKSTIQRIEKGTRRPSYEVLCKLEDLFGMTHRYLLAKTDEK